MSEKSSTNPRRAPHLSKVDFTIEKSITALITPAAAIEYLEAAPEVRRSSEKSARRIVTDIRSGNFIFTGDPIKFDADGVLIDGVARLAAIVKTNQAQILTVAFGIESDARYVIDTGATYTLRDALERDGVKNAGIVAAGLASIQEWERGDHLPDRSPFQEATTIQNSRAFLSANPEVATVSFEASKYAKKIATLTTKQIAAYIWALDKLDRADRSDFFAKLISGANTGSQDPLYVLRELLIANETAVDKKSARSINAIVIKAWNAYRAGKDVKQLVFVGGGSSPESFPVPL